MNERIQLIALAALLHDIGKFMLRAAVSGKFIWSERENQHEFGYKHAMLTDTFVDEYVPSQWRATVRALAGRHHRPRTDDERIIQEADHLSAGERDDGHRQEDDSPRTKHPQQLQSIFCQVQADGVTAPDARYLPLQPLQMQREAIFPAAPLQGDTVWRKYATLWDEFAGQMAQLRNAHEGTGNLAVYLENVLLLLQRYTWCIPSAYYGSVPDISLYDHSRMTAALAVALADRDEDNAGGNDAPVAQVIGADISGVQDFIYTITSRGATASLRGRSFYVQMLTEVVARFLMRELELPITSLIYVGGGNVLLLGRPGEQARLDQVRRKLSTVLLRHHRGDLYVAIGQASVRRDDLAAGRFNEPLAQLHRKLAQAKQQRFAELGDAMAELFAPVGYMGNEEQLCQVCGMEDAGCMEDPDTGARKCPQCRAFEELGDQLRKARFLMLTRTEPNSAAQTDQLSGTWRDVFQALEYTVEVAEDMDELAPDPTMQRTILALADDAFADLTPTAAQAVGRRLFVNTTPLLTEQECGELRAADDLDDIEHLKPEGIKPFSVLARDSRGVKRLGVLRMDVDNLGQMFMHGLQDKASLSRIAALSFAMSVYFDGWVAQIAQQLAEETGKERLYAIYSGGDDLFFVGAWDAVIDLAERIQVDLTAYAAGHPGIHASAGIVLVGGKYPLYQAAADAGAEEHRAKQGDKNAIALLGQAVPWRSRGDEIGFDLVRQRSEEIQDWLQGKKLPKSFVAALQAVDAEWKTWKNTETKPGGRYHHHDKRLYLGPWQWHLSYGLYRAAERTRDDEVKEEVRGFINSIVSGEIVTLGITSRWAELSLRNIDEEPDNGNEGAKGEGGINAS